jgi:hypothetical protein
VLAAIATALSAVQAMDDHTAADERAVATASERLATELAASVALLGGSDVMALDGRVDAEEFAAFSEDVMPGSTFTALAYAEPVLGSQRVAWESTTGATIQDTDSEGGFVVARDRPLHVVVRLTEPATDSARRVVGFDFMSDDVRAEGITQAGGEEGVAVVGPIRLATSGLPGVFVVNAVHDASGEVIGFIASGLSVQDLVDRIEPGAGVEPIAVSIDGTFLTSARGGSALGGFDLAGRRFEVRTGTGDAVDWTQTLFAGAALVTLVVLAVVTSRRARRETHRAARRAVRSQQLARLSERFVHSRSPADVLEIIVSDAASPLGADHIEVARRVSSRPGQLEVHDRAEFDGATHTSLDARTPLSDCVRANVVVEVWRAHDELRAFADVPPQGAVPRWCSILCVPVTVGGTSVAGIGVAWTDEVDESDRAEARSTAELIAEMAGRAYERSLGRQLLQERVDLLNEFSAQLAAAHSMDDIERAVETLIPPMLGVQAALLADERADAREADGPLTRAFVLAGEDSLYLVLRLDDAAQWSPTAEGAARAVVDLLTSAVVRARRSEDERNVLQRLQQALLTPAPIVEGFDIAVSYESAMQSVGIGGDWYSVVDTDAALFLVIGDVAGHGPGAVAVMAQVKTVIRHLLTIDAPIEVALDQASTWLEERNAYASAVIVRIDKRNASLSFVNAGHPFPLLRRGDDVEVLSIVHRPWLGVGAAVAEPTSAAFDVGASLLLYTDGLVEERHTLIDTSIEQLAVAVGGGTTRAATLVATLANDRVLARGPMTPDDDVALVAVTRTSSI